MIARAFIILVAPPVLVFTFFYVLAKEIRTAFKWSWIQVRIEMDSIKRSWREKSLKPEER